MITGLPTFVMPKNAPQSERDPFRAKLKHYHRTASPSLYAKKYKRWEDASPNELGDAALAQSKGNTWHGGKTTANHMKPQQNEELSLD